MSLITVIARRLDGLPLAGKMEDIDPRTRRSLLKFQKQAKFILRKLELNGPQRLSITSEPYIFHYLIQGDVCYLMLCAKTYPRREAFFYLELLAQEFEMYYGTSLPLNISRPYAMIEFNVHIERLQKQETIRRRKPNGVQPPERDDVAVRRIKDVLKCCATAAEYFDDDVTVISRGGLKRSFFLLDIRGICLIGIGLGVTFGIILICSYILEV